ncbi:uncharacterized protein LOC144949868 [Lampetra fluviatilis]
MASWIDFASIKQECEDDTSLETWPDLVKKSADIYGAELLKNVKIEGASERPQEVEDSHGFLPTAGRNFIKVEFDEEDRRKTIRKKKKTENSILATKRPSSGLDFNRLKFEGGANERPALTGSSRGCPATADQNFVEVELDEEDVGEGLDFNHFKFGGGANERPAVTGSFRGCPATADQNFVEVVLDEEDVGEGTSVTTNGKQKRDRVKRNPNETSTQRKRRLAKARQKYKEKRANEDEEARRARLQKRRDRLNDKTPEARDVRLQRDREYHKQSRNQETPEARDARLQSMRKHMSQFRCKATKATVTKGSAKVPRKAC